MKSPVRVAVLSESRIVREGLVVLVAQLGDRAIVVDGVGPDGHVDVAIYDLGAAPGPTRYAELRGLLGVDVPLVVLVYDGLATSAHRVVDHGGADHVISLSVGAEELWDVLERATGSRTRRHQDAGPHDRPAGLTQRELMVITLIGAGLSNKQIAARLFVSNNTVKTYIRTGYRKIGVQSRVNAALWAMEHGLVARPVRENPPDRILEPVPAGSDRS
jgi:NarL family two-component system response regulator LiaR